MDKKTKKMATTEAEMAAKRVTLNEIASRIDQVGGHKAQSGPAKKKQEEILQQLSTERSTVGKDFDDLRIRLELETLDMLSGADQDFDEPTPREALENAS